MTRSAALIAAIAVSAGACTSVSADVPNDPNYAFGTPTPQQPLTNSTGVAAAPWLDLLCRPTEGTANTDPGVPPGSWAQLLAQQVSAQIYPDSVGQTVQQAVGEAWDQYVNNNTEHKAPPGFASRSDAQEKLGAAAKAAVLDQATWEGVLQRLGNVNKPTPADAQEFLAHLDNYPQGVQPAACDGNDGFRLYASSFAGEMLLWQLGPQGSWAKVTYDASAPQPPADALWTAEPGTTQTYIASEPAGNPLGFGVVLARIVGELTIRTTTDVHSCLTDESTTESVGNQIGVAVYAAVQQLAPWVPGLPPLPTFSEACATTPAIYTPWQSGPLVQYQSYAVSNRARYVAGYTATSSGGRIDRWQRVGTSWLPGIPFASPTQNNLRDDTYPRLAISGDGSTVAGCVLAGPIGGGAMALQGTAGEFNQRFPEIFHFANATIDYPRTGPEDSDACRNVSLNTSGDTVWYEASDGWYSSATPLVTGGARSTIVLGCSPTSVRIGRTSTCTATVTGASHPTGAVGFTNDGAGIFDDAACTLRLIGGNQARCSVNYTPAAVGSGQHAVIAGYSGDPQDHSSSSAAAEVAVSRGVTTTSIDCSPDSGRVGQATTCAVTVSGAVPPTGTVGLAANQSGVFSSAACTLAPLGGTRANCQATYTPRAPGDGAHKLYAIYPGDPNNEHSTGSVTIGVTS